VRQREVLFGYLDIGSLGFIWDLGFGNWDLMIYDHPVDSFHIISASFKRTKYPFGTAHPD
jgi:hypothetical protein